MVHYERLMVPQEFTGAQDQSLRHPVSPAAHLLCAVSVYLPPSLIYIVFSCTPAHK